MRCFILVLLLVCLFKAKGQKQIIEWESAPSIPVLVDELVYSFGSIEQNSKAKHKFILKNDSIAVFFVKDVSTSCGCTTSSFTKKPVKNNEQAVVKISFDTSELGAFHKSAFVYNNFSFKPIKLSIVGEVVSKGNQISKANREIRKVEPIVQPNTN